MAKNRESGGPCMPRWQESQDVDVLGLVLIASHIAALYELDLEDKKVCEVRSPVFSFLSSKGG